MENEGYFKKIEVKVSANCCEGCKRKVKKALRNLEGVLSIDIDPLEPKIRVLGKVNPHILINKLQKVGKRAEVCSYEEVEAEEEVSKKEKQNTLWWEQEKQHLPCDFKIEKTKDVTTDKKKVSKDNNNNNMIYNAYHPQEMKKEESHHESHQEVNFMAHLSINPYYSSIRTHPQYCYIAQPCAVAVPYYAIPSHSTPPLPEVCVEEHCHFDMPRFQPPFFNPTVQVGDYFSDDNTMGCHVM